MKLLDILPQESTWDIIDQSKLTTYMRCPRKYFYSYVLGWKSTYPNNHLVFGTAWHAAVEHLLLNKYSKESLEEASILFLHHYRESLPPSTDEEYTPKDPKNALSALAAYSKRFFRDTLEYEICYTEIAGHVYIAPNAPMTFKMDAIVQDRKTGQISLWDHKTSQRRMGNWAESFALNTQALLYLHALYCMYGTQSDIVKGAKIRCSFFYKSKPNEFEEAIVEKTPVQMESWLNSVYSYYANLKQDMDFLLLEEETENTTLTAFPMNTTACNDFGRMCEFHDLCNAWENPLKKVENIPLGMKVEFWNPLDNKSIRILVDLNDENKRS